MKVVKGMNSSLVVNGSAITQGHNNISQKEGNMDSNLYAKIDELALILAQEVVEENTAFISEEEMEMVAPSAEDLLIMAEEESIEFDSVESTEVAEESTPVNDQKVKSLAKRIAEEMKAEVTELENKQRVTKTGSRFVWLRHVHIQDANGLWPYIAEERMEISEFEDLIKNCLIYGDEKDGIRRGSVWGYTELRDLGLSLDDFSNGEFIMEPVRGVYETITEGEFLSAMTNGMGNEEILEYRINSEIQSGRASSLMSQAYFEKEIEETSEEIRKSNRDYDYRGKEEQKYYYEEIKNKLLDSSSHKATFEAGSGSLFPVTNKETKKPVWLLPVGCISSVARAELLSLYHAKVDSFKETSLAMELRVDEILKTIATLGPVHFVAKLQGIFNPEEAQGFLSAVARRKKASGTNVLSYSTWKAIKDIADTELNKKPTIVPKEMKEALSAIEEIEKKVHADKLESELGAKFSKKEANNLLALGYQELKRDKKLFSYPVYRALKSLGK
jgi:hypothetical protein